MSYTYPLRVVLSPDDEDINYRRDEKAIHRVKRSVNVFFFFQEESVPMKSKIIKKFSKIFEKKNIYTDKYLRNFGSDFSLFKMIYIKLHFIEFSKIFFSKYRKNRKELREEREENWAK